MFQVCPVWNDGIEGMNVAGDNFTTPVDGGSEAGLEIPVPPDISALAASRHSSFTSSYIPPSLRCPAKLSSLCSSCTGGLYGVVINWTFSSYDFDHSYHAPQTEIS